MHVWILTYNRPQAVSRLIKKFNAQGIRPSVLNNGFKYDLFSDNEHEISQCVHNSLNCPDSNSWCARSWNTCILKALESGGNEFVLIQDDTDISDNFISWLYEKKLSYDFIWGPGGDQFHYIKKEILDNVGWWDERFIGCYAGDADFMKRVYLYMEKEGKLNRLSVEEHHNWGFHLNTCEIRSNVNTELYSKAIDSNYENQHWQFERIYECGGPATANNPIIKQAQKHYRDKWGVDLDINKPLIESKTRLLDEIDWYPWASKKYGVDKWK